MLACPPYRGETSATLGGIGSRHRHPLTTYGRVLRPVRSRDGGRNASPTEKTRSGRPSSHTPIRAERSTLDSHTLPPSRDEAVGDGLNGPPSRDETVRPRDRAQSRPPRERPLNRETLSDRPTLPTPSQRTTNPPEPPVERGEQDSEARPEDGDARVDDEPFHREADRARASMTTTRKPVPGPYTARVIERPGKWNTVAKTHFQSNLSHRIYWYVAGLCRTVSHNVNTVLLQCAPNLLNILLIHTTNANAAVNLTVTILHNFELKRDTAQTKNDLPAQ